MRNLSFESTPGTARLKSLDDILVLDITDSVKALARKLVEERTIPGAHPEEALHVAVRAVSGMDFLLTWNFSHLKNAFAKARTRKAVETEACQCPEICSIDQLFAEGKWLIRSWRKCESIVRSTHDDLALVWIASAKTCAPSRGDAAIVSYHSRQRW
jgi:hypothetical protein